MRSMPGSARFVFIKNDIIRRLVKNSGYLFSATGISAALSLLQSILVARLVGVFGVGLLGTITMFASVVNNFASFRMNELVIKYVGHFSETDEPRKAAAVFKAAAFTEMLASIFAFVLIWLLAPLGAKYLAKDPTLAYWFVFYGLIVIANLISESSTGLLQIFDRYRRMAALTVAQSLFTLAVIGLAYINHGGILEILLAYLGGKTIGALGLTIAAVIEASRRWGKDWWRAPLSLLRPQARELVHFAVSTNLSGSLSLINKDSELLWVSFFRSPLEAGYYKTAMAIVNLVQMPVTPLPQATYPELSRAAARKNWESFRYVLRQGAWMAGVFTLAVALALLFFGKPLILLLYKKPEFLPAYPALMILLAGFLVANTFYWNRVGLLALGRPDYPTKVNFVLAILKIAGIILLVPRFGYLASAALFAGSYILGTTVSAWKIYALLPKTTAVESRSSASE